MTENEIRKQIKRLGDKDVDVRVHAAWTLAEMGPRAKDAVPNLIEALEDESTYMRVRAVEALGKIGPYAKAAVPALIETLGDTSRENWNEDLLLWSGPALEAAIALGKIGEHAAVPALTKVLKDEKEVVSVRGAAAVALGTIGDKASVPILCKTLNDEKEVVSVRGAAAVALGTIGYEATLPFLFKISCTAENYEFREAAGFALRKIGKSAIAFLVKALESEDNHIRYYAALHLGKIGPDAKVAVPTLIELIDDEYMGTMAIEALGDIGGRVAVPALTEALKDKDLQFSAAKALEKIGPDAKVAVPALIEALKDEDFRVNAARILGSIGTNAKAAVPALIELIDDEYMGINAIHALGGISDQVAVQALTKVRRSRKHNKNLRDAAALALFFIKERSKDNSIVE